MRGTLAAVTTGLLIFATPARSQTPVVADSVIAKIQREEQERSQLYPLAQTLMDSIGPRLAGSIEQRRANEWVVSMYRRWGIPVREERYGTWNEWRREIAHVDLIAPRKRPLEGVLSTWSPGTKGAIEAGVVVQPDVQNAAEFEAWLPRARGKFVLLNYPWPSCRPDAEWKGGRDAGVVRANAGGAHRGVQRVVRGAAPIRRPRHRPRAAPRRGRRARRVDVARAATRTAGVGRARSARRFPRRSPRSAWAARTTAWSTASPRTAGADAARRRAGVASAARCRCSTRSPRSRQRRSPTST